MDIDADGGHTSVAADSVYVMIGGELADKLLRGLGVEVDVKFGTA